MNPIRWLLNHLGAAVDALVDFVDPLPRPANGGNLDDFTDDPEYQKFVAQCAEKCTCTDAPCDSCLAGGICDDIQDDDQDYLTEH